SLAEQAFFEGPSHAETFVPLGGVGGVGNVGGTGGVGAVTKPLPVETPLLPIPRRLAGTSRLAFRVPEALSSLPLTVEGLLAWDKLEPSISARAVSASAAKAHRPLEPIAAPALTETAVEAPWRLVVSPNESSAWLHATAPVTHEGRTELWHTRLGVRVEGRPREDVAENRTLRAIWSPDYRPDPTSKAPADNVPFRSSLSANDRHQIVRLSSDYTILQRGGSKPKTKASVVHYEPQPIAVDRFMLSPLGAWAELRGDWDLTDAARIRESLSVEEWQHVSTLGRDHFARVVYAGLAYPCGHRASLIKTTERKVQTIDGAPVAILRQRFNVVIRQPFRSYAPAAYPRHGREMPLTAGIRIHTLLTPDLDLPAAIKGTKRSFWIAAGEEAFRFPCTGTDVRGRPVDFQMAAIFVSFEDLSDETVTLTSLKAEYEKAELLERRTSRVGGRKMAFAPSDASRPDSTTLDVDSFVLVAEEPVGNVESIPFLPKLATAAVRLPAVEQLVGNLGIQGIKLSHEFLTGAPNAGGVFAELTTTAKLEVPAERAGALATPNLTITGISERLGPVAGDLGKLADGKFEPSNFFDGSARLLGGISLGDIVRADFSDAQLPALRTVIFDEPDGSQTSVTTLSFKPALQASGPFKFRPGGDATLAIDTIVRRRLGSSLAPEQTIQGVLSRFSLDLAGVIAADFDALRFTRNAAGTLDVAAELADDAIRFDGPLAFVNQLRKAIPPELFGGGLILDVGPAGVRAGFSIALPPLEVGVLSIKNAALSASVFLPFLQGQARLRFGFAERHRPFQLAVSLFGGGGFLAIGVGLDGVEMIEGALEFGGSFSINLGVASGGVEAMAGFYFKWEVTGGTDSVTLTGYLRVSGAVEVLGLITISITLYLGLTYHAGGDENGKVQGQASLTVKVDLTLFSKSVTLSVERSFGGGANDPPFGELVAPADWLEYSEAFA
ncbi:MAG TPA: hypothetical protein VMS65_00445, partial [Polyangiaceae bacterium]|nr:hypothetical protein [Polyangiaceae bacterium]